MAASIQTSSSILSTLFRPSHSHKTRFSARLLKLKHFHIFCRRMASASAPVGQDKVTAQYGSWKSPITADVVSGAEKRLSGIAVDGAGRLLWVESRPSEAGRAVLVKGPEKPGDKPIDVTPEGFAVRTLAQEYGGGAFTVSGDIVIFSNYKDQRLYKQFITEQSPTPITPDYDGHRVCYADGVVDSHFDHYITVREDHRESTKNPATTIVAIDLKDGNIEEPKILVSGNDFYAFPRVDPKGKRLAWIEWGHPNMHWDKAELWVGYISENGNDMHSTHGLCLGLQCPYWLSKAAGDELYLSFPKKKMSLKGEYWCCLD